VNVCPFEVLLVEDNPGDVLLTTEALEEAKLHISMSVTSDGVEALDFLYRRGPYAEAPRPDLLLLDLNIPHAQGRQKRQTPHASSRSPRCCSGWSARAAS
jgi:CheY-like chemotaxis protein